MQAKSTHLCQFSSCIENDDNTTCMRVCAEKADCTPSAGSKDGGKRFKVNGRSDHLRAGVRLGASVSVHSDRLIDLDTCLPAGMQAPPPTPPFCRNAHAPRYWPRVSSTPADHTQTANHRDVRRCDVTIRSDVITQMHKQLDTLTELNSSTT